MTVLLYRAYLGHELGACKPSENPELLEHSGLRWARVFRVTWRRR